MNKIFILVSGIVATSGMRAEESMHIALLQAVVNGQPSLVSEYLEQGAHINQKAGGYKETPVMFAIRAFAKEAEDRYTLRNSLADMGTGLGWMTIAPFTTAGTILFPLALVSDDLLDIGTRIITIPILAEIGYGTFKLCKGFGKAAFMVPYSLFQLYKRKKVIELLINYPSIDLFVTNSKNQTALDLIHNYMLVNAEEPRLFHILKQVERMLLDKQRKPSTSHDSKPDIKAVLGAVPVHL
jgi:hypothetical protein